VPSSYYPLRDNFHGDHPGTRECWSHVRRPVNTERGEVGDDDDDNDQDDDNNNGDDNKNDNNNGTINDNDSDSEGENKYAKQDSQGMSNLRRCVLITNVFF
jgi:hypothetical protein